MTWMQRFMHIVWPGFLAACIAEFVVFALVDPGELHWGGASVPLPRQAVYAGAFFLFWGLCAASSALTLLLARPSPTRRAAD